jgi:transposase
MAIVEERPVITGGVGAHADLHAAAALDPAGGMVGVQGFPAAAAGYASLLGWLGGFGDIALAGVEGTGSYGAGLARHLAAAGVRVVEAGRADRQDRRRQGKSDPAMRSARRGPRGPAGHRGRRRAATGRWRRSGR